MTDVPSSDIVSKFNQFYYDAYRTWGTFYSEAYRDLRAYAGDNWLQAERVKLQQQKRMVLELNKIRRVVNMYSGYERENRMSTIVSPLEDSDEQTAEDFTDTMLYVYDKGDFHQIWSEAFDHMLKTGLAVVGIYLDYSKDKVNGNICFYWKPFNALMFDPYFTKRSLADCDQASMRDLFSKEQVKALLPFISPEVIDNLPTGIRDNKYLYLGIYRQYNSQYIAKNLLTYDQYWVRENKPVKYIINLNDGSQEEWEGTREEEKMLKIAIEKTPHLKLIHSHKATVRLNIIVGGVLLYDGPDPTGLDTFPFVLVMGYFEPLIDTYELKIQGIVRSIRDAQRQYNRRHSQIIDLMESVVSTGWIHKNGAVLDPNMLYVAGAGRTITLNDDADMSDIREIQPPQIPQGFLQYQDIMDQNIIEIPGGNDEILGISKSGDSQVSGTLAENRASNGLKGNRGLFDNSEFQQKQMGELVLQVIQNQYSAGKVQKIIKREPTEQFFTQNFQTYGCTIKEAILTQTQREGYYYNLLQLRALGIAIPDDEIILAAPMMGKSKMVARIKAQQEQAEIAQVRQLENEEIQRQLVLSQKEENLALAQERRARVLSDIGLARERMSESSQNYAKAMLDNVKTIAEMELMDHKQIMGVMELQTKLYEISQGKADEKMAGDLKVGEQLAMPIPIPMTPMPEQESQQMPQGEM